MKYAYLLTLEVESVDIGKVYVALPLHCTVMPWFRSNLSPAEITRLIKPVCDQLQPIELVSSEEDLFGSEKDIPVNKIMDQTSVQSLHKQLLKTVQDSGAALVNDTWVGDGYVAHVTRQRSGRFEQGRSVTAKKLCIVQAQLPDTLQQKYIVTKLSLGGAA